MLWHEFLRLTPKIFRLFIEGKTKFIKSMERAANIRAGQICATIASQNSKKKWKPSDFFKFEDEPIRPKKQSVEELDLILRRWTLSLGGEIIE